MSHWGHWGLFKVTFLSPIVGGHQQPFQKGHVGFHHTKKTVTEPQNCQEGFVWCETCSKQFLLIQGVLLGHWSANGKLGGLDSWNLLMKEIGTCGNIPRIPNHQAKPPIYHHSWTENDANKNNRWWFQPNLSQNGNLPQIGVKVKNIFETTTYQMIQAVTFSYLFIPSPSWRSLKPIKKS